LSAVHVFELVHKPGFGLTVDLGTVVCGAPIELSIDAVGLGRVVLRVAGEAISVTAGGYVTVGGANDKATHFQWMETPTGDVVLMSLATNRFLRVHEDGKVRADSPGPRPDGLDGTRFRFAED
jgi:hypothetical protein